MTFHQLGWLETLIISALRLIDEWFTLGGIKMKFKFLVRDLGFIGMVANTIVMIWTFMIAYFNDYRVLVDINQYGEAHFEIVLVVIFGLCSLYFVVVYTRDNIRNLRWK